MHLQPSLMFKSKARSLPLKEAPVDEEANKLEHQSTEKLYKHNSL